MRVRVSALLIEVICFMQIAPALGCDPLVGAFAIRIVSTSVARLTLRIQTFAASPWAPSAWVSELEPKPLREPVCIIWNLNSKVSLILEAPACEII